MDLTGFWQSQGYTKLFHIKPDQFTIYDISRISCIKVVEDSLARFYEVFDRFEQHSPESISMYARGGITRYLLWKLKEYPAGCRFANLHHSDDPQYNFDVFCRYFTENYAFFDLRGVNWEQRVQKSRLDVNPQMSAEKLADVLAGMIRALNDSHVTLEVDGRQLATKKPHALVAQWQKEFQADGFLDLYPRGVRRVSDFLQSEILRGRGKSALKGLLVWGKLSDQVGYIAPLAMMDFYAGFDLLYYSGFEVANLPFLDALGRAMDEVVADLTGLQGVIVDARFNPGGHDAAGTVIAGRFADQPRLAFTKQAVHEGGLTEPQEIFVRPLGERQLTMPVTLLTSPATASAAEVFVHSMIVLPHVTRMGEATRGVLSDMLLKKLPNGWVVSLSNEIYRAADGNIYEGSGVPPQVPLQAFYPADFYGGLRRAIDEALHVLAFM